MRIVGVHGVGNHRPGEPTEQAAANLATSWRAGIAKPDRRLGTPDVAVAYYADLLRPRGRQDGVADLDQLDDFELELVRSWLVELPLPAGVEAGYPTWPLRQVISWINRTRFPGRVGTEWFVATFFREVARYLRDPEDSPRHAARERVAEAVTTHRPDVLIAHSLGSVVAYETLWAFPRLEVDLFVTLGSPLALRHAVFPRLHPRHSSRPPNVRRWVNLADPGDIVAIPPGGVGRLFSGVHLDEHTVVHGFDFHLAKNYLRSARLADALEEHQD